MAINGAALTATLAGAVLTYSGVKGKKISTTLRDLLKGQNPGSDPTVDMPITGAALSSPDAPSSTVIPSTTPGAPGAGGVRAANQGIARGLAAPLGWSTGTQWDALVKLWDQESGWNNRAVNASSGATGIPQALPPTKMPRDAQSPIFNPISQIVWGLSYIKSRYGNPVNAWAHEVAYNWY